MFKIAFALPPKMYRNISAKIFQSTTLVYHIFAKVSGAIFEGLRAMLTDFTEIWETVQPVSPKLSVNVT